MRSKNLEKADFFLLPCKNESCLFKNLVKQVNWIFTKIHALNGFNRKMYTIGHLSFLMNKLENFQRLVAWLFCLDELQCFACRLFLHCFVTWKVFWWVINKIRKTSVFVPTEFSSGVCKKLPDRDGLQTHPRRTKWIALQSLHLAASL